MAERLLDTEQAFREARRSAAIGSTVAGGIDLITKTILKHLENKRLSQAARQQWENQLKMLAVKHGYDLSKIGAIGERDMALLLAKLAGEKDIAKLKAQFDLRKAKQTRGKIDDKMLDIIIPERWLKANKGRDGKLRDENGMIRTDLVDVKTGGLTGAGKKLWLDDVASVLKYSDYLKDNEKVVNGVSKMLQQALSDRGENGLLTEIMSSRDLSSVEILGDFIGQKDNVVNAFNSLINEERTESEKKRVGNRIIGKNKNRQFNELTEEMADYFAKNTLTGETDKVREEAINAAIKTTGLDYNSIFDKAVSMVGSKLKTVGEKLGVPVSVEPVTTTITSPEFGEISTPVSKNITFQRRSGKPGLFGEATYGEPERYPSPEEIRMALANKNISKAGVGIGGFTRR